MALCINLFSLVQVIYVTTLCCCARMRTRLLTRATCTYAHTNVDTYLFLHGVVTPQCMGVHPRLALLTSTLKKSIDDLWHAFIIITILMSTFACIATWKFGASRIEFTTFGTSIRTEFSMLFGESRVSTLPTPTVKAPGVAFTFFSFTHLRLKKQVSECVTSR